MFLIICCSKIVRLMIMDSQWFNQEMNGCDHNNAGKKIDLTLKLGLPNCDENNQQPHIGQHLDFDQIMTPHHASLEVILNLSYSLKNFQ